MAEDTRYKDTIHLPQTAFAMQANLAKREPEMLAAWNAQGLYQKVQQSTQGRPVFYLVDGPPYANGDIHIGHAVNKVLKDMVVKAARLDGKQAPFVPGWDCHGLPIELQVEKKFGKVGDKLNAAQFRAECRVYAAEQVERQREDFKRLGVLADWHNPYLTMQPAYEAEQLRVLGKIAARGHLLRGFKPVHWCLDCGSSLAEAEVEYENKQSTAVYVGFEVADSADFAERTGVTVAALRLVIWTTTPWTLPANQALCVHPELDYTVCTLVSGMHVVIAHDLLPSFAQIFTGAQATGPTFKGQALVGLRAVHPFAGRTVPVIAGEHVTADTGTGLVHTAPAHGVDDFIVGKKTGLPVDNPVGSNGVYLSNTPVVAGMHVRKVEETIFAALGNALLHKSTITHSYPHCWRHKTPLIFRATPQWFISMDAQNLRGDAASAIAQTRWIPQWGEARIAEMVKGRPDWCISRQRFWGVPLALFVHRQTQLPHLQTPELLERIAQKVEADGLEAWFASSPADWGVSDDYEKCTDTLDVWFDSGVGHQCTFKATNPAAIIDGVAPMADMYLEGSDQHRGWFQSSLLTSVAMQGRAPYKAVLTHGFTVDEQGRKMSKSLGNVVAPQKVTSTLGADVLRLWAASSDYSGEIAISDNLLKRTADAYRRIRNTARYFLGSLHRFSAADALPPDQLTALDAWAMHQAAQLQTELQAAYAACEFHRVYHLLHNYCVNDLGGLYLDVLKDRLYTLPVSSVARKSAQTALWHIAEAFTRWIAPILSFTADEIWQHLPGDRSDSVFAQTWWQFPVVSVVGDWPPFLAVREEARKQLEGQRIAGSIGSALQAELDIYAPAAAHAALALAGDELRFWLQVSAFRLHLSPDEPGLRIVASASTHPKCERCWHYQADVGTNPAHPSICNRCVDNIEGAGENRAWF